MIKSFNNPLVMGKPDKLPQGFVTQAWADKNLWFPAAAVKGQEN